MSERVKLTKPQLEYLAILGKVTKPRYVARSYKPAAKLVVLGLAQFMSGSHDADYPKIQITPAGRAYLAKVSP